MPCQPNGYVGTECMVAVGPLEPIDRAMLFVGLDQVDIFQLCIVSDHLEPGQAAQRLQV